ncbi:sulfur carrier protein ThiS [Ideonella sp. BN130291]|uniref:sulfur carrier protein ThiS n=1 Tax=Ideonella sp. BN130291 TaxID=3112940 RepID=UPI002E274258|nr:sulfur carrier protein ThiS [Ideonella sp. BN130291]
MTSDLTAALIPITLNGNPELVPAGCTIEALLRRHHIAPSDVGTALNGDFVPRAQRATLLLQRGDAVTCFQPIVGG